VLRPAIDTRLLTLITLTAAIAVYDTLCEFQVKPDIKWANDVMIGDRKISGILAETTDTAKGLAVILGIGINLNSKSFTDEIALSATSMEAEAKTSNINPAQLEASLLKYLGYWYAVLNERDGGDEIRRNWQQRSSWFSGKEVRVMLDGHAVLGTTDGLESNGALRIRRSDGSVSIVHAGDVERIREL
jgi:BirA family biotin operon repressor/biotin-[acetyl-CoA-carboxylase] ligase